MDVQERGEYVLTDDDLKLFFGCCHDFNLLYFFVICSYERILFFGVGHLILLIPK